MYPFLPHGDKKKKKSGGFQILLQHCICNRARKTYRVSSDKCPAQPWSLHVRLGPPRRLQGNGETVLVMAELRTP